MNKFIKNIEIKNYKCFQNFKANNFKRVNLIGGENNIGKTTFLESCFLSSDGIIYNRLLEIKTHRDMINNLLNKNSRQEDLRSLIIENQNIEIKVNSSQHTYIKYENNNYKLKSSNQEMIELEYNTLFNRLDQSIEHSYIGLSLTYISVFSNCNYMYEKGISSLKLNRKLTLLNSYLKEIFNIEELDYISGEPQVYTTEWRKLSQYGQGLKTFINIIFSLLILKDSIVCIDEIESGIHYKHFDKLWEIVFNLSKEQNVQIFSTTHSKECIESFNRVQKRLEAEDTLYFEISKNKKTDKLFMRDLDREQLEYELLHQGRYRGE